MHAFVRWHALVATAFLALRARGLGIADAADARAAAWAFVIGAALTIRSAIVREGATVFARRAAGDAGAFYAFAADRDAIGISAAFWLLADPGHVADLASGAVVIAATGRAIGTRGARVTTALVPNTVERGNTFEVDTVVGSALIGVRRAVCVYATGAQEYTNTVAALLFLRTGKDGGAVSLDALIDRAAVSWAVAFIRYSGSSAAGSRGNGYRANEPTEEALERRTAGAPAC